MPSKYWFQDSAWWNAALDRVLKTAAQALIAAIAADQIGWFHQWQQVAGSVGAMALLSFLTAIVMPPQASGRKGLGRKRKQPPNDHVV